MRIKRVSLSEDQWFKCTSCDSSGLFYMERNLHESAGWIPCGRCHKGIVKEKIINIE